MSAPKIRNNSMRLAYTTIFVLSLVTIFQALYVQRDCSPNTLPIVPQLDEFASEEALVRRIKHILQHNASLLEWGMQYKWERVKRDLQCWTSAEGEWQYDNNSKRLITQIFSNDAHLNTKIYTACGEYSQRTNIDYVWRPPRSCTPIPEWSPANTCRVMQGRAMVFIGDSLSMHMGETFINAMGERTTYSDYEQPHAQPYTDLCVNHGHSAFTTYIVKAPRLLVDVPLFKSFIHELDKTAGVVLVANWGAFYLPDEELRDGIREFATWVDNSLKKTTFIFRSTNMAHAGCDAYSAPISNWALDAADEPDHPEWKWSLFPAQSRRVVLPELKKGQLFLDILPLSQKRPDGHPGHVDCLHYCLPGPMDTWVIILMGLLEKLT